MSKKLDNLCTRGRIWAERYSTVALIAQQRHQSLEKETSSRIGSGSGFDEVPRAAPIDHVAGDGEGSTGKADQRGLRIVGTQTVSHAGDGLQHWGYGTRGRGV